MIDRIINTNRLYVLKYGTQILISRKCLEINVQLDYFMLVKIEST